MVVREAFFLGVFLGVFRNWRFQFRRFFLVFKKLAFFSWRFFGKSLKIGVFNLGVFFSFFRNWRFFLGVFLGVFFCAFFLGVFWMVDFFKLIYSKKWHIVLAFFWAFFWSVFLDEFRKLAFFSWRFLGVFILGVFFYFRGVFFGRFFWAFFGRFFSKNQKNASLNTIASRP